MFNGERLHSSLFYLFFKILKHKKTPMKHRGPKTNFKTIAREWGIVL
jgi:hypothetical protein